MDLKKKKKKKKAGIETRIAATYSGLASPCDGMFRGCGKEGRARQATEQRSVELMSLLARGTSTQYVTKVGAEFRISSQASLDLIATVTALLLQ